MVTDLFLSFLISFVNLIITPLPEINLPVELLGGLSGLVELFSVVSFLIPVSTLVACIAWVIALHNKEFLMSVVNWILKKIPGLS